MSIIEAFLIGGIVGAVIGITVYHFGISTLHAKLDTLIAYVKGKAPQ